MARLKGGLIESTFDVSKRAPLDARELVTKYEDLINPSIWLISGTTFETLYNGLAVSVNEVGPNMGKYFLIDRKAITQENYNNYLNAKNAGEDTSKFFQMWEKLATENLLLKTLGLPLESQGKTVYELLQVETERAKQAENILSTAIEQNADDIADINNTLPDLIKQISEVENTLNFAISNDQEGIDSIKELASWLNEHGTEVTEITSEISKLNKLVGDTSVSEQIIASNTALKKVLLSKEDAKTIYEAKKFEISGLPKGSIVTYGEKEIRVMCPKDTEFTKQSVGATGNANNYYMTVRAYAPDNAIGYREYLNASFDKETLTDIKTDKYGRKFQTTWLGVAVYSEATNTWFYYGANSTNNKYVGWDYRIDWYDAEGNVIDKSTVRVNLTNENCHDNTEPYYLGKVVTGAQIGETALEVIDRQIHIPVGAGIKDSEEVKLNADGTLSIQKLDVSKLVQTGTLVLNGGNAD